MSFRTGREVNADKMAVAMVMPALGPSLGVAPSGTWTWMSVVSNFSAGIPYLSACERIKEIAANAGKTYQDATALRDPLAGLLMEGTNGAESGTGEADPDLPEG